MSTEYNIQRTDDRRHVSQQMTAAEEVHRLQMRARRTCSESSYLLAAAMLAVTLRVAPISCVLAPVLIATADPADRSVIALDRNSAASAISAIISVGPISGSIVVAVTRLRAHSHTADRCINRNLS